MKSFIKIGHRGALAIEPENTLRSFRCAMELGVDMIELDVHLTKDKEIVVIHDETLKRTAGISGNVKDKTLAQLKELNLGNGEKIPTLQEVIDLTKGKVLLNIEIKALGLESRLINLIKKNGITKSCYCISFIHKCVKKIKELEPRIKTGVLTVGMPIRPEKMVFDADADSIHSNYKFVTKNFVKKCHSYNIKVFVWTVNKKKELEKMVDYGVDGIASDDPNIFK